MRYGLENRKWTTQAQATDASVPQVVQAAKGFKANTSAEL